jgi:hypothetical protein
MGLRDKTNSTRKLAIQKETLRKLALRPVDDDQLRAVNGGRSPTQFVCAPSYNGC